MVRRLLCAAGLALCLCSLPAIGSAQDRPDDSPEDSRGTAFQRVRGGAHERVPGGTLLVVAYAFVWTALFGYVLAQWRRQSRLKDDLARLEKELGDDRKGRGA